VDVKQLISEMLVDVLIEQWGQEVYNSHIYLEIMAYLKNMGLDNIANIFYKQYKEELGHSEIILNLLLDLNANFQTPSIEKVGLEINGFMDIANFYLEREMHTTTSLNEIKKLAIEEDNPVVEERIREMILLQQNEYEEATTLLDKAKLIADNGATLLLFDASLGE